MNFTSARQSCVEGFGKSVLAVASTTEGLKTLMKMQSDQQANACKYDALKLFFMYDFK